MSNDFQESIKTISIKNKPLFFVCKNNYIVMTNQGVDKGPMCMLPIESADERICILPSDYVSELLKATKLCTTINIKLPNDFTKPVIFLYKCPGFGELSFIIEQITSENVKFDANKFYSEYKFDDVIPPIKKEL